MNALIQPIILIYRLLLTFGVGYLCCYFIALNLAFLLQSLLPKAEAVYLAALIALICYVAFVISIFCIQNLKKLTLYSLIPLTFLFTFSRFIG